MSFEEDYQKQLEDREKQNTISVVKTASIEDLKQNPHVQGLLEDLKFYGTQDVMARTWNKDGTIEIDFGTRARAKLKEWEV